METNKTRQIAATGMLVAVAVILQYIELPVPILMPTFIKFDCFTASSNGIPFLFFIFASSPTIIDCISKVMSFETVPPIKSL